MAAAAALVLSTGLAAGAIWWVSGRSWSAGARPDAAPATQAAHFNGTSNSIGIDSASSRRPASESTANTVRAETGSPRAAEFTLHETLHAADWYAASPTFNPRGAILNEAGLAGLQSFLISARTRLDALRRQRYAAAKEWAELQIALGNSSTLEQVQAEQSSASYPPLAGRFQIALARAGQPAQFVLISPGDCQALDEIDAAYAQALADIHESINAFFQHP
jgi:hypothetical protein